MSAPKYFSSLSWPPHRSVPADGDDLFEHTPPEQYDLNTVIPVPPKPLETALIRVEPMIPSLHADALHKEFSTVLDEPLFSPSGKPYASKIDTLKFIETQRRRTNFLLFAIMDKASGELAGQIAIGCDPTQSTRDVKMLQIKVFPRFRRTHVADHAEYLLTKYILDPVSEGGMGCVRATGRVIPENTRSLRLHERGRFLKEGIQRSYDVYTPAPGDPPPRIGKLTPDGRVTKDAVAFSLTIHDWLVDGVREKWKAEIDSQTTPIQPRLARL